MPPLLGKVHKEFVKNFLNNYNIDHSKYPLLSLAQHKNGFIFPISFNISIKPAKNDFVIVSAISKDDINDNLLIAYTSDGEFLGISKKMMLYFKNSFQNFDRNKLMALNIFECCPPLKDFTKDNISKNQFLLNQLAMLVIKMTDAHNKKSSRETVTFEIFFDLKLFQHKLSMNQVITIFNMSIKEIETVSFFPKV